MFFQSEQLTDMFSVSHETIRNWTREFTDYLSPTANPGKRRKRQFSYDDLTVLALVAQLRNRGLNFDDIHVALRNGQRGTPPIQEPTDLDLPETESDLIEQLETLKRALSLSQRNLEATTQRLQEMETQAEVAKAKSTKLETQLESAHQERERLQQQVSELIQRIQDVSQQAVDHYARGFQDGLKTQTPPRPES